MGRHTKDKSFDGKSKTMSMTKISMCLDRLCMSEDKLSVILKRNGIEYESFLNKVKKYPFLKERLIEAKELQARYILDNLRVEINEVEAIKAEIDKKRLKFDFTKWYLGKLLPKEFGDTTSLLGGIEVNNTTFITKMKDLLGYAEVNDDNTVIEAKIDNMNEELKNKEEGVKDEGSDYCEKRHEKKNE